MLDENLPTYRFRQSPDSPTDTLLHYTSSGSDPTPAFLIRRPPPSSSRARYAAALADPSLPSIIYAETLVIPDWHTTSAPPDSSRNSSPPREPVTPSTFTLTLYNPDQTVTLKHSPSGWNRSESWDFEIPERTFRMPSSSQLDRSETSPAEDAKVPKVAFRWKKDGRMSRDMTCYMVGRSVDGRRSKEPDITVALFSQGKESCAVTVYEPNMRRVEIEDRKGLEVVLLLGAEAIRSLYLNGHKGDPFNLSAGGKRRESRPSRPLGVPATAAATMTPVMTSANAPPTKQKAGAGEREKRDREEQERIRRMLDEEEAREKRRRDAEVDAETERLRKLYGVPAAQPPPQTGPGRPPLPPRPGNSPTTLTAPTMPPRPLSAGPHAHGAQGYGYAPGQGPPGPSSQGQGQGQGQGPGVGKKVESIVSGFFRGERDREREKEEERKRKVQKKRSVHF